MKVLIVDDEAPARLRLRALVEAIPEPRTEVAGEAAGADEALRWLQDHPVDVLLLDIHLPGRNGLAMAAALRALPQPPAVVFVTAHAEHAVDAFDLEDRKSVV